MNLQSHIKLELWNAISSTYQADNYTPAILDAIHYLSDVLREKSGAEGDGASLVGQALGGDSPKLRINKLQTETERNEQKGFMHIVMGIYEAIRNPRSHEQIKDDQNTADAIIYFINYVLDVVDKSHEPFTIQGFLNLVFDPYFVESDETYADALSKGIPQKRLPDTLIEIYRNKAILPRKNYENIVKSILKRLSKDQIETFISVVSEELLHTSDEADIRLTLLIFPPEWWPRVGEVARLRTENRLKHSIRLGEYYLNGRCNPEGALGSWANTFLSHFSNKQEIYSILIAKIENEDATIRRYVTEYFMAYLPDVVTKEWMKERCLKAISKAIINNDEVIKDGFRDSRYHFPEEWRQEFEDLLKDVKNDDGTPFFVNSFGSNVDDIPF